MNERRTAGSGPPIFYWGVWPGDGSGHGLMTVEGRMVPKDEQKQPWTEDVLDSHWLAEYIWDIRQREGVATVIHTDGWTALAFWDRSGDERYPSRSVFIIQDTCKFPQALAQAKKAFPTIFDRIKFEIVPWTKNCPAVKA